MISLHLTLVLLVEFLVYFIHDLWPYMVIPSGPYHPREESIAWLRIVLIALCGIIIPMSMPRPDRLAHESPTHEVCTSPPGPFEKHLQYN